MTHPQTHADLLPGWANPCAILLPAHGFPLSVLRNGSAAVSKTAGRGSIPRTFATNCQPRVLPERAANSLRHRPVEPQGFFIWHDARSSRPVLADVTPVRDAGVFDTTQAVSGVRALHEQTGGRIE